ncbi:MAG: hypothetical protein AABY89_08195 [Acidobacteriota bacterium]
MGRESKRKAAGRALQATTTVSTLDPALPDVTVSGKPTRFNRTDWMEREEATSPDPLPEDGDSYAKGSFELVDKLLQGKLPVNRQAFLAFVVVGCFVFVAWLFAQDNAAARLASVGGIGWFWFKALQVVILAAGALAVLWLLFRKK